MNAPGLKFGGGSVAWAEYQKTFWASIETPLVKNVGDLNLDFDIGFVDPAPYDFVALPGESPLELEAGSRGTRMSGAAAARLALQC